MGQTKQNWVYGRGKGDALSAHQLACSITRLAADITGFSGISLKGLIAAVTQPGLQQWLNLPPLPPLLPPPPLPLGLVTETHNFQQSRDSNKQFQRGNADHPTILASTTAAAAAANARDLFWLRLWKHAAGCDQCLHLGTGLAGVWA